MKSGSPPIPSTTFLRLFESLSNFKGSFAIIGAEVFCDPMDETVIWNLITLRATIWERDSMHDQRGRGLHSVIETARMLRFEPHYVYTLIWRGKLQAIKQYGRWRIPGSSIRRFEGSHKK